MYVFPVPRYLYLLANGHHHVLLIQGQKIGTGQWAQALALELALELDIHTRSSPHLHHRTLAQGHNCNTCHLLADTSGSTPRGSVIAS